MSDDEIQFALNESSIPLRASSKEDRTYHLFFVQRTLTFFVGVVGHETHIPTAITILTKEQHEKDRGQIPAEAVRAAAFRALPAVEFEQWASTFDWAAQRFDRRDLMLCARYTLADDSAHQVVVPLTFPLPSQTLAGGNLQQAVQIDAFLARSNIDLYTKLGEIAPQALSRLTGFEITYGPHTVVDMLAHGGAKLLARFESRRVTRNSLMLFVTFTHDMKIQHTQKSRPSIPPEFIFENMLPDLVTSDPFLTYVKGHVSKLVPQNHLLQALTSISELQICIQDRCIDLVSPGDRTAIERLVDLAKSETIAPNGSQEEPP